MAWRRPALTAERGQEEDRHAFERFRAERLRRAAILRIAQQRRSRGALEELRRKGEKSG